jgi:sulfur-carrier protein adenylyltransferase/sulfurtransferase
MPDEKSWISLRHLEAVEYLDEQLRFNIEARRLNPDEIASYKHREFTAGWRLPLAFGERLLQVDLLVSKIFPYLLPSLALAEPPEPLTWPHVEENGILCLLPTSASYSTHDPYALSQNLIISAHQLIDELIKGANQKDFLDEFNSYWCRSPRIGREEAICLLEPRPPSRVVSVWRSTTGPFVGENKEFLSKWLSNRYGSEKTREAKKAGLLWMDRPLYPSEYPSTADDILRIVEQRCIDSRKVLNELIENDTEKVEIVLGANTKNGACWAGVIIPKPDYGQFRGDKYQPLDRGFRAGRVPPAIRANRFWQSSSPVSHLSVQRADRAWIHGRDRDIKQAELAATSIMIVGCGSIGGWVAKLLAMAGVGRIVLIDHDRLSWANTGRHILGANSIGKLKAQALAQRLLEDHPHLAIEPRNKRWEEVALTEPELVKNQRLILSLTGDWGTDSALNNYYLHSDRLAPVLYGWTEPHACAGHALVTAGQGGCLECGFSKVGVAHLEVTTWKPEEKAMQEAACGAIFQPFGPIELNHTVTLIGEYAIDILTADVKDSGERIWACRESFLSSCGGQWTDTWFSLCKGRSEGGFVLSRDWPASVSCPSCQNRE